MERHAKLWDGVLERSLGEKFTQAVSNVHSVLHRVRGEFKTTGTLSDDTVGQIEMTLGNDEEIRKGINEFRDFHLQPRSGLPNKAAYGKVLNEIERLPNARVAVAETDLKNFKGYNDKMGYVSGDRAIAMHGILMEQARQALGLDSIQIFQADTGDEIKIIALAEEEDKRNLVEDISKLFEGYRTLKEGFAQKLNDAIKRKDAKAILGMKFLDLSTRKKALDDLTYHPLVKIDISGGVSQEKKAEEVKEAITQAERAQKVAKLMGRGHVTHQNLQEFMERERIKLIEKADASGGREQEKEDAVNKLIGSHSKYKFYERSFPFLRIASRFNPTRMSAAKSSKRAAG